MPGSVLDLKKRLIDLPEQREAALRAAAAKGEAIDLPEVEEVFFRDLTQDILPDLSKDISRARHPDVNDGALVERLVELKDTLLDQARLLEDAGGEVGQAAKRANDYYSKNYVPAFKKLVGDKFRRKVRSGQPIPGEDIGRGFLKSSVGSQESANQIKHIIATSPNRGEAEKAIREFLIGEFADRMRGAGNKVDTNMVDFWLNNPTNRAVLKEFPDIRKEVLLFRGKLGSKINRQGLLGQEVQNAIDASKKTEKEISKGVARFYGNGEDTVSAVGKAISSPTPARAMAELVEFSAKDKTGQAKEGLRAALSDHLQRAVQKGRQLPGGQMSLMQSQLKRLLTDTRKREALEQLYTKGELKILDRIQSQMDIMDRINVQVTSGSSTAPLLNTAENVRTIFASLWGIVKGTGIFFITKRIRNAISGDPKVLFEKALIESMLNPELAKQMLKKPSTKNLSRVLRTVSNNLLPDREGEERFPITETARVGVQVGRQALRGVQSLFTPERQLTR